MNKRNIFITLNLYASFLFLIIYTLKLGISFKTGLELTPAIISKMVLMSGSALAILILNIKALNVKNITIQIVQFLLLIPMFMPSQCVIKFGATGNPVYIMALFLILCSAIILMSNTILMWHREKN